MVNKNALDNVVLIGDGAVVLYVKSKERRRLTQRIPGAAVLLAADMGNFPAFLGQVQSDSHRELGSKVGR